MVLNQPVASTSWDQPLGPNARGISVVPADATWTVLNIEPGDRHSPAKQQANIPILI